MNGDGLPKGMTFTAASAAIGVEGLYDPKAESLVKGIVSVTFRGSTVEGAQASLRRYETALAGEVLRRLETYDSLVAERDELRRRLAREGQRPTNGGFRTAEVMLDNC